MSDPRPAGKSFRFGVYEVDGHSGELRRSGVRVRLQDKPFRALGALLERPGQLVTREELQQRLWPEGTHVDFEAGLNTAMNRLREVLRDSAESPRFIETVPRRGYRFVAPVEPISALETALPVTRELPLPAGDPASEARVSGKTLVWLSFGTLLAVGLVLGTQIAGRWHLPGRQPDQPLRLLVLPFENLAGGDGDEIFSDGLTEEMILQLGGMQPEQLSVIARTSAMQLKNQRRGIAAIGAELKLDYVLEGTVRRQDDRVRVAARLVRVSDETPLWSESYDRELRDILEVQADVSRRIADALTLELLPGRLGVSRTVDPVAYEATLLGRHFLAQRTRDGFQRALESFDAAIVADPEHAPAWAGRADTYTLLGNYDFLRPRDAFPEAERAALRAIELAPELAEPWATLGMIRHAYHWDWAGAEQAFQQAIELNAGYAPAHHWYAVHLTALGRHDEALARLQQALHLDPLSRIAGADLGWRMFFARRHDEAVAQLERTLEIDPSFLVAHDNLSWIHFVTGNEAGFREHKLRASELEGATFEELAGLRGLLERDGWPSIRRTGIEEMVVRSQSDYQSPYDIALEYAALSEIEPALDWLARSCEEREIDLTMLNVDPRLDPLRAAPRFREIADCVALPQD